MATNHDMESDAVPYTDSPESDISRTLDNLSLTDESTFSYKSDDEFINSFFEYLPPNLKVDCYDVMLLYHEEEHKFAETFKQHISKTTLRNGNFLKVALYNGPEFVSLSGAEFENLEEVFNRCTFTFVLLSKLFVKDTWCKLISQSFLMNMISDSNKKWCIIPVLTATRKNLDFKIPMGLNALKPLKFYEPIGLFNEQVQKLVSDWYYKRSNKEQCLKEERLDILKKQFDIQRLSATKCVDVDNTRKSFQALCLTNAQSNQENTSCGSSGSVCKDSSVTIKADSKQGGGTGAQGENFLKKIDNKDYIRNRRIVTKASYSVGIIRGPVGCGTGFRVGERYVMTALHVVNDNIRALQSSYTANVDYTRVVDDSFYIEFEFLKKNQKQKEEHVFNFKDLVYKNTDLDTAILELRHPETQMLPPPIRHFGSLPGDAPVYLIGHPKEEPLTDDPKIEMYEFSQKDIDQSNDWARRRFPKYLDVNWYAELNNHDKILFHCASQHGASGALGVMVDPHFDEPVGVLMLLRGFPPFYYLKDVRLTDEEKEKILIVEQGVLLKSIANDMDKDSEFPKTPELRKEIFSQIEKW